MVPLYALAVKLEITSLLRMQTSGKAEVELILSHSGL